MKSVFRPGSTATTRNGYHHGNLRAALLRAAEEIIRESGVEGLTLRACARRAGVSHGAPAHHFENITGLLTEVAAEGFERLTEAMNWKNVKEADDDLQAAGLGYIQFAMRWPEHFQVMWRSELLNEKSPRLRKARQMAQQRLRDALIQTNAHRRTLTEADLAARFQLASCCVHGYASLWVEGNRKSRSLDGAKRMLRLLRTSLVAP
ncbi:MAG TPA: TetR/AcrR family transcriptional regulator [Terriglobales bacterium]|nr:TetR/AcrR family transcriptional regulator [Terriglobales bacterium]